MLQFLETRIVNAIFISHKLTMENIPLPLALFYWLLKFSNLTYAEVKLFETARYWCQTFLIELMNKNSSCRDEFQLWIRFVPLRQKNVPYSKNKIYHNQSNNNNQKVNNREVLLP